MTKKFPIDKEKQSLFQKFKNPLSKSKKSPENYRKSRSSSKSRCDLSSSDRAGRSYNPPIHDKDDRIRHVRRVIHLNQKYLNSSNNSLNGVISHMRDKKRERSNSSNHKCVSVPYDPHESKSREAKNKKKYSVDQERKQNYRAYTDTEHEKMKRVRKDQLQKKANYSDINELDVFSDTQASRSHNKYKSERERKKIYYSDSHSTRQALTSSNKTTKLNEIIAMSGKSNNNAQCKGPSKSSNMKRLPVDHQGDKSIPIYRSKCDHTTRYDKSSIPEGFFNSSDECSDASARKYLDGSPSPRQHNYCTDSDGDVKYVAKRNHSKKVGMKHNSGAKRKDYSLEQASQKSDAFNNIIAVDTDDSESFVIHNQRDSERYANKREYKKVLAGYLDDLNSYRKKVEDLTNEKDEIQRELNNIKLEFESLSNRYKNLKKSAKNSLSAEMEKKTLNYKNKQLQQKIDTLSKIIEERDEKQISLEAKLIDTQRESSKYSKEAEELRIELNHYKEQFQRQLNEKDKFSDLKRIEQEKDFKIRVMHNEIIELKGNVRVIARFKMETDSNIYQFSGTDSVTLKHKLVDSGQNYFQNKKPRRTYSFNRIFRPSANQEDIYTEVSPYVTSCIDGYNVCVMTYGQTGSGKTYTMKGSDREPGIIPRAVEQLFDECKDRSVWTYKLYISILQIYNEYMTDLLTDAINRVYIQDDGSTVFIKGLQEFRVKSKDDIEHYIKLGKKRCTTAKTILNVDSSRSHFIVMLRVSGSSTLKNHETQGILTLCDLAGFEKFTSNDPYGKQATETKFISKSLTVLARVFDSLRSKQRSIPFRESKLTHLLKPSLSGDAKCVLILTLSSAANNVESSIRSLDFGVKAMKTSLGAPKKNVSEININKNKDEDDGSDNT